MRRVCKSRGCSWPVRVSDDICDECAVNGSPAQQRAALASTPMPNTPSTRLEELARGLTPAQRRVLLALPREYGRWWSPIGWLLRKGLIAEGATRQPRGKSYDRMIWHPTPLGLELRNYLRAHATGEAK